ncbi:MAG: M56 family metallopeptidase, partial [Verrucomicrobiota bacterium]
LVALILWCTRRASARFRHSLAIIAAVGVPLIFVLNLSPIPDHWGWRPFALGNSTRIIEIPAVVSVTENSAAAVPFLESSPNQKTTTSSDATVDIRPSLVALWWLGLSIVGLRFVRSLRRPRLLNSEKAPADLVAILDREAKRLNLKKTPTLLIAENSMPMTFGIRRSFVVLPSEALDWAPEKLQAILTHELMHIRRRDLWSRLIVDAVLIPVWWHPLARQLRRKIEELAEQACDDAVISNGAVPAEYADDLLSLSRRFSLSPSPVLVLPAMSGRGQIARFRRLLDEDANRSAESPIKVIAAFLAALGLLVPATLLTSCATTSSPTTSQNEVPQLPALQPEIEPVPQNAEQLLMQIRLFETDLPLTDQQLPEVAEWIDGDREYLDLEQGFQVLHPQKSGIDILSFPSVIARPGMNTKVEVGQEIPILSTGADPELEMVGISIESKFWATADPDKIRLEIEPLIAEIVGNEKNASGDQIPQIRKMTRKFSGVFPNGSFFVIGVKEDVQSIENKVPLLGDIPVTGGLFRARTEETVSRLIAAQIIVSEFIPE